MFHRVLIANRGEIAVRIARTCRAAGLETVAIYSDADRGARHVAMADRAVAVGAAPAADSYLSLARVLDAARAAGADAVHPGYGFLSEHAGFAAACTDAGLTFIGPSAETIARFGSKIEARRLARAAGVPVVPGETPAEQTTAGLVAAARTVGLPLLLKPSAGGGGKGMVAVHEDASLETAIDRARREALATAGDATLYVERRLHRPRHIEVQIVADTHGGIWHLGERECSIQRRHQKVVEESPAAITPGLRHRLTDAAVRLARHAGYAHVGTVEFLVEGTADDAPLYFLEMNTRLQVEHPVTELVTGVDLVRLQLDIAAGRTVAAPASAPRGHAIQCRVYAEDPARDFLPQAGTITGYQEPAGPGLRVDSGVAGGSDVPVHYDPLLAKLIAAGATRHEAIRRAVVGLGEYAVLGVRTNLGFLRRLLMLPAFADGALHTDFLVEHGAALAAAAPDDRLVAAVAAAAACTDEVRSGRAAAAGGAWQDLRDWRLSAAAPPPSSS